MSNENNKTSIADAINAVANGSTEKPQVTQTEIDSVKNIPVSNVGDVINNADLVIDKVDAGADELIKNVNEEVPLPVTLTQRVAVPGIDPSAPKATAQQTKVVQEAAAATMESIKGSGLVTNTAAPASDAMLPELAKAFQVAKMNSSSALKTIVDYARDMHPAQPQTKESIEKSQVRLLNALFTILSAEDENFGIVFKGVLAVVRAHRNEAFKITMIHRGMSTISHSAIDNATMLFLTRLLDTLQIAAGLRDISQVKKQVDMDKLLSAVANVRAKKNLTNFFS